MKMSSENFSVFKEAIESYFKNSITRSYKSIELSYINGGLTPLRCRWDVLWKVKSMKLLPDHFIEDKLYKENGLDDSHIDTALKKVLSAL